MATGVNTQRVSCAGNNNYLSGALGNTTERNKNNNAPFELKKSNS